jgi:hypothetical protein
MSALFKTPDIPAPIIPPMPAPPAIEDAAAARQKSSDLLRKRKGRMATVLTSPEGINKSNTGAPTLLGS